MRRASAAVRADVGSPEAALAVRGALAPENAGFVEARVEGSVVLAEAEAEGPGRLLHTLDDYLACLGAAEKAARVARQ